MYSPYPHRLLQNKRCEDLKIDIAGISCKVEESQKMMSQILARLINPVQPNRFAPPPPTTSPLATTTTNHVPTTPGTARTDTVPQTDDHIPETDNHVPGTDDHIPGTGDDIPGTGDDIPETDNHVPGTGDHFPETDHHVPGTGDHIPGTGDHIPETGDHTIETVPRTGDHVTETNTSATEHDTDDTFSLDNSNISDIPASVEEVETAGCSGGILQSAKLMAIRKGSCSRKNFAARLNAELFDEETRMKSNVSGKDKKLKLNPVLVDYIRSVVFQYWPLKEDEKFDKEWRACRIAIDEKNRRLNNKPSKPKQQNAL